MRIKVWVVLAGLLGITDAAVAKGTGLVFVSSEKSNAVAVLDPKTHKVTSFIALRKRPTGRGGSLFSQGTVEPTSIIGKIRTMAHSMVA